MTEVSVEEHTKRQFNQECVCVKNEVITQFEALTVDVGKACEGNNSANITDLITSGKDMLLTTETQCLDIPDNSIPGVVFHDSKEAYFLNKNEVSSYNIKKHTGIIVFNIQELFISIFCIV